jgi:hypothetical protein
MVVHHGYPRRKRAANARSTHEPEDPSSSTKDHAEQAASRASLDVAGYVSDMTAQLEAMALAAGLDLLAYFLGMARSEADLFVRTNTGPEGEADGGEGEGDGLSDEDQARFDSSGR